MRVDPNSASDVEKKIMMYLYDLATEKNRVAERFLDLIVSEIKRNLEEDGNIHTWALHDQIWVRYIPSKEAWAIEMEPYWKYIEYGTSPHNIPKNERIIQWIKDKYYPYKKGNKTLDEAFYMFAMYVREHGTQPYPFVRRALLAAERKIRQRLQEEFKYKVDIIKR